MLEAITTTYSYPKKACLTSSADWVLIPLHRALGGKEIAYDPKSKEFRTEEQTVYSLFTKIILGLVAIVILPITFIACIIKLCDEENRALHKSFLELDKKKIPKSELDKTPKTEAKKRKEENPQVNNCPICLDHMEENTKEAIKCMHVFHRECIAQWNRVEQQNGRALNCPVCRDGRPDRPAPPPANLNQLIADQQEDNIRRNLMGHLDFENVIDAQFDNVLQILGNLEELEVEFPGLHFQIHLI